MNVKLLEGNDGEVHNVTEWANILGISRSHLRHRMKNGEDFLDIIKSPRKYKKHKHGLGKIVTQMAAWEKGGIHAIRWSLRYCYGAFSGFS